MSNVPASRFTTSVAVEFHKLRRSLALPDVKEKLAEQGIYAETSTPAEFTKLIADDQKRWAAVIKAANIRPE